MAHKFPRPQSISRWLKNPFLEHKDGWSVFISGYWYSPLKLPISSDRNCCLEVNQIYAGWKYQNILGSTNIIEELAKPVGVLADGVLFLGSSNHYHYLVDGLGNLTPELFITHKKLFVDSDFSEDQLSFLESYIAVLTPQKVDVIKVEQGTHIISNVIVPMNDIYNSRILRLRANLSKLTTSFNSVNSRIYVSRHKANTRRIVNENKISESLTNEFNFVILSNERMTLMQQLELYWNAKVIIGSHGAGLTNAIFMKNPHAIVDIWHSLQQPFFKLLASSLNTSYIPIEGNPCCDVQRYPLGYGYEVASRVDNEDYWVDVNVVTKLVSSLLNDLDGVR